MGEVKLLMVPGKVWEQESRQISDVYEQLNLSVRITRPLNLPFIGQNHPTVELHFHLYGRTNEGLAVQKQSAEICHFYEKGIILMRIMGESPLRGHICNSLLVISPLLIKIGELKSLGTGFLFELNIQMRIGL